MIRADRNRLFPDVEVEETADLAVGIHLGGVFFEPADQIHLAVKRRKGLVIETEMVRGCYGRRLSSLFP
jgi:hypothetical protein